MSAEPKLYLVFDIDETLLHSVMDKQKIFDFMLNNKDTTAYNYCTAHDFIVVFRPGLHEFFDYLKQNKNRIHVGLWTYGSKEYADTICKCLEKEFGNSVPMHFVYSINEIEADLFNGGNEKDLRRIFNTFQDATHLNTILIDNRAANIYHDINYQNGYIVESFEPLNPWFNQARDFMFEEIEYICNAYFDKCYYLDSGEPIFSNNNVKKLQLTGGHHLYKINRPDISIENTTRHILSSHRIDEDENFQRIQKNNKKNGGGGKKKRNLKTVNPMRNRQIRINKTKRNIKINK